MHYKEELTGLILAGGAGRRMQGRDKGLVSWQGRRLVEHVAERLRPQVGTMLISCNRNQDVYASYADALIVDSRKDYQGPLAGLEAASGQIVTRFVVITPCDAPLLPLNLGDKLVAALDQGTELDKPMISYAFDGDREQYLFAAMRSECLRTLSEHLDRGERKVRDWYYTFRHVSVDFTEQQQSFANVNSLD